MALDTIQRNAQHEDGTRHDTTKKFKHYIDTTKIHETLGIATNRRKTNCTLLDDATNCSVTFDTIDISVMKASDVMTAQGIDIQWYTEDRCSINTKIETQ